MRRLCFLLMILLSSFSIIGCGITQTDSLGVSLKYTSNKSISSTTNVEDLSQSSQNSSFVSSEQGSSAELNSSSQTSSSSYQNSLQSQSTLSVEQSISESTSLSLEQSSCSVEQSSSLVSQSSFIEQSSSSAQSSYQEQSTSSASQSSSIGQSSSLNKSSSQGQSSVSQTQSSTFISSSNSSLSSSVISSSSVDQSSVSSLVSSSASQSSSVIKNYTIDIIQANGGAIEASATTAKAGEEITLSNTSDIGYSFVNYLVTCNGQNVEVENSTFIMPMGNVEITAVFNKVRYQLNAINVEGGTIDLNVEQACYEDEILLFCIPLVGYEFVSYTVSCNGENIAVFDGQFTMPAGNVTISATFVKINYSITIVQAIGGKVSVIENKNSATYGEEITLSNICDTGYSFVEYTVKQGETIVEVTDGKFTMPAGDVTVTANFSKIDYALNVIQPTTGGRVEINASTGVFKEEVTLYSTPEVGYELVAFTVTCNGENIEVINDKFTMPAGEVNITATFRKIVYTITINQSNGGSITTSKDTATYGEEITLTNVCDTGYSFGVYTVKQGETKVEVTDGKFTMPAGNVTVTGSFSKIGYTITINQVTGGTISTSTTTATYGDDVTLTNTLSTGYKFDGWVVKQGETELVVSNDTFTMPAGNVTVTGSFSKINYTITITQATGGTISVSKTTATYGESITLTKTATSGYSFGSWTVKQGSTAITVTGDKFTMPAGNVTVTASWTPISYTLTVNYKYGSTTLKTETFSVAYKSSKTVTGPSIEGYTPSTATKSFTMDTVGGKTVTYDYTINSYTITVTQPSAGGSITAGGKTGTVTVNYGSSVSLASSPSTGYQFSSWTVKQGSTAVTVSSNKFTMPAGNVTVTASFSKINYTITITQATGGTISASKTTATYGESITLTKTATSGYNFGSWTVKQGSTAITVTGDKFTMPAGNVTVTASWTPISYTLTVNYKYGSTTLKTETFSVAYKSSKTVTGPSITGYTPSSATKSFTMDTVGGKTVTYDYSINSYTITVTQPSAGGSITAAGKTGTITVNYGTSVALASSPSTGYQFSSWTVKQGSTAVTVSSNKFTMPAGNVTVTGSFSKINYTITITQATGGTISASKTTATYGESITLTKTATSGYNFGSWTVKQGSTAVSVSSNKFTMPAGNVTVTASWTPISYTLTVNYKYGSTTLKTETFSVAYNSTKTVTGPSITGYTPSSTTKSFKMDTVGGKSVTYEYNINSYTITVTQATGGSITAAGKTGTVTVNYGTSVALANTPSTGYKFGSWTVKQGSTAVSVSSNKFTMPAGNVTVTASFSKISYTITVTQVTGGTIKAKNLTSNITATYGESVALTNTPSTGYKFGSYSVKNGSTAISVSNNAFTMPAGNVTVTGTFSKISYTITVTQVTGGTIKVSKTTANYQDSITLSNTPTAGYVFSSYTVKQGSTAISVSSSKFTMPAGNVTVTGSFVKGIGGLGTFTYYDVANYNSAKTGSITVNGGSISSSQTYYPSATSWVKGDFYYEVEIALNSSKIYNGELYCKAGIVIQSASEIYYGFIDALAKGWNNGGFGNNTWLGFAPGRGDLAKGVNWSYWGSADYCGNFNKNYSASTTYVKLAVLRVGGVYKFFANDKFMYSIWQPEAQSSIKLGIMAFNIGFEVKNSKIGYGSSVVANANAYYGLTSGLHPTSRTIDGKVDGRAVNDSNATIDASWKENLTNSYGTSDYTRYAHFTSFKGSDGIYVAAKARTKNYITNKANIWENTNVEINIIGANQSTVHRVFFAANGSMGVANSAGTITSSTGFKQAWKYYQDTDGYYVITLEGLIPYSAIGNSNSSQQVVINYAFRSEEVGLNMQDGADGVWWSGMTRDGIVVGTSGLSFTRETTPTDKNIKPGVGGADPFVLPYNNKYYLYATTGTGTGYRVYVSNDLKSWRVPTTQDFTDVGVTSPKTEMKSGWAMHKNWSNPVYYSKSGTTLTCKNLWAPEVAYNPTTKKFVMTYSGYAAGDLATVSVATSDSPLGPFIDVYGGVAGFLKPTGDAAKASIDASIFVDTDGKAYLYYCNDCTRNGIENFKGDGVYWGISEIWVVALDSTWTKTTGTHTRCITPTQYWETQCDTPAADGLHAPNTAWNEGPYVYKYKNTYYMTYSANPFWNALYGVGLAFSKSPTGPWTKYHANPIVVKQAGKTAGTGHNMFFKDFSGKLWCAYHTYSDPNASGNVARELLLSRAWFDNGILRVEYGNW